MHKYAILCVSGNHFEFECHRKVILNEKHETYISQLQIMQKPEIVHFLSEKSRRHVVLAAFLCFANLKMKDTEYRT